MMPYDAIVRIRMRGALGATSAIGSPRSGGASFVVGVRLSNLTLLLFSQSRHWTSISQGSQSTLSSR